MSSDRKSFLSSQGDKNQANVVKATQIPDSKLSEISFFYENEEEEEDSEENSDAD